MATEKPRGDENDDRVEQDESEDKEVTEDSNAATVEEQSEQSFPASDPPSY
jgi:hypothetical protein